MIFAVASGKGGTGKTTIATSLALALARAGHTVSFGDNDVEAPNAHLFLSPDLKHTQEVDLPIPQVDELACTACGTCAEVCQFHAIVVLGGKTLVFPELCHGCGSCTLTCPENAIQEVPRTLGRLSAGPAEAGIDFYHGYLDIGQPMAVPVIHNLKTWLFTNTSRTEGMVVLDSPPGASCPVVESLREADYVILVTEPTPFGLHDLRLAVEVTREINIPCGVILNRAGIGNESGDSAVERFCRQEGIPILMRIPFDREIGMGIAQGKNLLQIRPAYERKFLRLVDQVQVELDQKEPVQ